MILITPSFPYFESINEVNAVLRNAGIEWTISFNYVQHEEDFIEWLFDSNAVSAAEIVKAYDYFYCFDYIPAPKEYLLYGN